MEQHITKKNYLLLKKWWETVDLTNYEKRIFNSEIISFNQQLFRLKESKLSIGIYGKSGVGKSYILNLLLNKKVFKTDIINGSTKEVQATEWSFKTQRLKSIELIDSPGFDFCNIGFRDNKYSRINNAEFILFVASGDLNRNEVAKINYFIKNGKKIIIVLNKIEIWNKNELEEIMDNITTKIPSNFKIPVIVNSKNNLRDYITNTINLYGEIFLTLNSLQMADKLFLKIKEQRLKKRKKKAQSVIGKFATIKASTVALNPLIIADIAGSFAIDTALISELSKVYGLSLKGESARKIIKNISINNFFLGAAQIGINTSFNVIRKAILIMAPFTNGMSLVPYGPIAIIQAAIAIRSTKILGKLAAKEIFIRSKSSRLELSFIIRKIMLEEPDIFNHINFYLLNRNINQNLSIFLP